MELSIYVAREVFNLTQIDYNPAPSFCWSHRDSSKTNATLALTQGLR